MRADLQRLKRDTHASSSSQASPEYGADDFPATSTGRYKVSGSQRAVAEQHRTARWRVAALALVSAAAAVALALWWKQPAATPTIEGIVQLTHDGLPKKGFPASLASDGSRVYLTEQRGGAFGIAQVSVAGGETVPLASGLVNPTVFDV